MKITGKIIKSKRILLIERYTPKILEYNATVRKLRALNEYLTKSEDEFVENSLKKYV